MCSFDLDDETTGGLKQHKKYTFPRGPMPKKVEI